MSSFGSGTDNVLYLVVCAAPPARESERLVRGMQALGWDVCIVTTQMARYWLDAKRLANVSGHVLRTQFRDPDDPAFEPFGDAVLVAPATFNTINKVAAGINDTLALGLVNEALGAGVPVAFVPCVGAELAGHPAYLASVQLLAGAGAAFLDGLDLDTLAAVADRALRGTASAPPDPVPPA
jgi:phosphopantothenoylcysteine decarboxylase